VRGELASHEVLVEGRGVQMTGGRRTARHPISPYRRVAVEHRRQVGLSKRRVPRYIDGNAPIFVGRTVGIRRGSTSIRFRPESRCRHRGDHNKGGRRSPMRRRFGLRVTDHATPRPSRAMTPGGMPYHQSASLASAIARVAAVLGGQYKPTTDSLPRVIGFEQAQILSGVGMPSVARRRRRAVSI